MRFEVGNANYWRDEWSGKGHVFVDGVEIRHVYFADEEAGVVKTFDIFHKEGVVAYTTAKGHFESDGFYTPADFPGREIQCERDDVLRETLRGTVKIVWDEGTPGINA